MAYLDALVIVDLLSIVGGIIAIFVLHSKT